MKFNSFKQFCLMVVQTFLNFIEIGSLQDSNQFAINIRELVISEFVKTEQFCKDLLRLLPGIKKNFAISENYLYPCSYTKRVLLYLMKATMILFLCLHSLPINYITGIR